MPSGGGASARPAADSARGGGSARVHEVSSSSGRTSAISSMCPRPQAGQRRSGGSGLSGGASTGIAAGGMSSSCRHTARGSASGSGWPGCRSSGSAENWRVGRSRAGRKKPGGQPIQRPPAGERPLPGATQCRCGWNCSAEPHVCRTRGSRCARRGAWGRRRRSARSRRRPGRGCRGRPACSGGRWRRSPAAG